MDRLVLAALALASILTGCTTAHSRQDAAPEDVVILVRNPSSYSLSTTVCGPVECSSPRILAAGGESRFVVQPGRGSRAVVTAKLGDRVVAQHPVDFSPGEEISVDISAPGPPSPVRRGSR
jgi:ABC-type uncharacterized transport system auxiliary subunit